MEENPYKAPVEATHALPTENGPCKNRRTRWVLPVGCLWMVAIWIASIAEMLATGERLLPHWNYATAIVLYAASALSWLATAWALWKNQRYVAILAVICDFALCAIQFVGWTA